MKQKILLKTMLLLCALIVGSGSAWADVTVTLTQSNLELTGSYTSGTEKTIDGITYVYTDLMKNSDNIQAKASTGVIYNKTAFSGDIKSVAITHSGTARATTISGSSNGTDWTVIKNGSGSITGDFTSGSYKYFKITRGSNAAYWTKIEITYSSGGGGDTPTTYTVTYDANGGTGEMTDPNSPYEEDDEVTLLANTFTAPEGQMWSSWLVKDASNNEITVTNNTFTMPASNVTVTAQWANDPNAPQYEWVLTDLANLTYEDVFVIVGNNGSNYALSTANGTSSAPPAYPITIANDKINVDDTPVIDALKFNISGNATNGYTFYPNGSTTTYIYCTDTNNGVRVGKPNASTTEKHAFTVTDGYLTAGFSTNRYIGIYDSSDWRCYTNTTGNIADQTFTFYKRQQASSVATPTFSVASGTYHESQSVVISCETSGATIYYTTDGNDPTSSSTPYTTAISITETTTLKAIAIKDGESSNVASATYTIQLPLSTIPALFAAATSTGTNVNVTFGNWVVSGVSDSNAFVTDNNGNGFIIYNYNHGFAVNDKLSGTVTGTPLKLYYGSAEFTNLTASTEGLTVSHDGEITVITDKTIADLGGVNTGAVITLNNLTYDGSNLSDGENTIEPYSTLFAGNFASGKTYNVTGVYRQYQDTKQILPRSAEDIEEAPSIAVTPATDAVDAAEHDGTLDITYYHLTISDITDFGIQYYDAEGKETTEPDWIEVLIAEQDPSIGDGYVVSYYMLENNGEARTAYFKVFATGKEDFVYSNLITITQAAPVTNYELYSGNLIEGDYIIYYDGYAMNTTVNNSRLQYETVTLDNDVITPEDATIVWHIAPSGDYWTLYNAGANAYAASTGGANKAQMLADGTGGKALWKVSGTSRYEFVNKYNNEQSVNANLRNNGTYGFACYSTSTGGALSLYKREGEIVTLNSNGYATFASNSVLDFSDYEYTTYSAWQITGVSGDAINFSQITTPVAAGTGILLKGTAGASFSINTLATGGEVLSGNKLEGITEATNIEANQYYGLSGNTFKKVGAGTVPAGKALLPVSAVTGSDSGSSRLTFVFEDATGISTIEQSPLTIDRYYDMQGRRVDNPKKGMYIVNGKKVVMK